MRYLTVALVVAAVALAAAATLPLANTLNSSPEAPVPSLTYVPSKNLYIDYAVDVGLFLRGEESFGELVRDHYGGLYWVKGRVVSFAVLDNVSAANTGCGAGEARHSPIIFLFRVEDVIKGPADLVGETAKVYDLLVTYDDGKALFTYDHLPLVPGKTYVLGLRPHHNLTMRINECGQLGNVVVLDHTVYSASTLMRFLVTGDGRVIYLYDRDALYGADPDYANIMSRVSDPVVVTYTGSDPHLTGKATYDEFRAWLLSELGP